MEWTEANEAKKVLKTNYEERTESDEGKLLLNLWLKKICLRRLKQIKNNVANCATP